MCETNLDTFDEISKQMIENMTDGKKQKVYKLWEGFELKDIPASIMQTLYRGGKSQNSYSFCETKHDKQYEPSKCTLLRNIFGIKTKEQKDLFIEKYNQAASGLEGQRITTLHSSSLCCLLFFYNVGNGNGKSLIIKDIETKNGKRTIEFTNSYFEFKNPVFDHPSNIDVVLTGNVIEGTDKKKDVVLFLESKFAEYYLNVGRTYYISTKYLDSEESESGKVYLGESGLLEKLKLKKNEGEATPPKGRETEKGENVKYDKLIFKESFYIEGIKQMVSHYLGIRNLIKNCKNQYGNPEDVYNIIKNKNPIILLGEILFDFEKRMPDSIASEERKCLKNALDSYKGKYKVLVDKIREQLKDDSNFDIISTPLTYSEVFQDSDHIVEDNIKKFYRFK